MRRIQRRRQRIIKRWIIGSGSVIFLGIAVLLYLNMYPVFREQRVKDLSITFLIDGEEITGLYTGQLKDRAPTGNGLYLFEGPHGSWSFEGTIQDGTFFSGMMIDFPYAMSFTDRENCYSKYTGRFENKTMSGIGKYTVVMYDHTAILTGIYDHEKGFSGTVDNLSYTLEMLGQSFNGYYSGAYENGKPEGEGTFQTEGDPFCRYSGNWHCGKAMGTGTLETNAVSVNVNNQIMPATYTGETKDGIFSGNGTITVQSGEQKIYTYSGTWAQGHYHGIGTMEVALPESISYRYEGEWKDGLYDGEGSLIYDSDQQFKYIGHFENGKFHPTFVQLVQSLCSAENSKNSIPANALQYLEKNQEDFLTHNIKEANLSQAFDYQAYMKNQENAMDLSFQTQVKITQSRIYDPDSFGTWVTELLGYDSNGYVYLGHSIGEKKSIQVGEVIQVTGYPIGYASVMNTQGESIPVFRFIALGIE